MPQLRSTLVRSWRGVPIVSKKRAPFSIKRWRPAIPDTSRCEKAALLQATGRYEEALSSARETGEGRSRASHAWRACVAAGENGSMGRRPKPAIRGRRRRQWRVATPVQPTAVRMGRERDAPRRSGPRGSDLWGTRRNPARARSGTRTSRRGGARARTVGPRDGAHHALLEISTIRNIARFMRRSWPRARPRSWARSGERAAAAYELLLARRPEAYADHAAAFFMGVGNRPQRAVEARRANWKLRDTPRSRSLLARALRNAEQVSTLRVRGMIVALAGWLPASFMCCRDPITWRPWPRTPPRKAHAWRTGFDGVRPQRRCPGRGTAGADVARCAPGRAISAWGERCVGLVLIGIGVWGLRKAMAATRRYRTASSRTATHVAWTRGFRGRNGSRAGRQLPCAGNRAGARSALRWRRGGLPDPVRRRQRRSDGIVFIVDRVVADAQLQAV